MSAGDFMCDKHFKLLLSENRKIRKQNLDELTKIVSDEKFKISPDFMLAIKTYVYPCLNDSSEACRESAINLMKVLVCLKCVDDIAPIIFTVHKRMGNITLLENSEEIRLLYIQLLWDITKNNGHLILPCLDDVVSILVNGIVDPCPAVKKESCLCVVEVVNATKTHFHMVAESLIEPLLKTTNFHQSAVRYTAIQSLSKILIFLVL
jgi:dynein assembly factor 5